MTEAFPIILPLVNPNEPGALLAALYVSAGQHVERGQALCTLETTKSTLEVAAEASGYLVGLAYSVGQTVQAGDILGYLAESAEWTPPVKMSAGERRQTEPTDLHISRAALVLAEQHQVDLAQFPADLFITEKMVREKINLANKPALDFPDKQLKPNSIVVYGGGGHGKALIDLIRLLGTYPIVGIVDDGIGPGTTIMGVQVLGGSMVLDELLKAGAHLAANAVGGIGNIAPRLTVFEQLARAGFSCPTLVHPTAFVEPSAVLAEGVQVMPHAYIGSEARVGFGAIINTGAIVSHDCQVGAYANLSPGAILAGEVTIGEATLIGMGVTVNLRVSIGTRTRIGNGATVKQDVPEGSIVRAGSTWPG
jgi:acetyltransferase EpsM